MATLGNIFSVSSNIFSGIVNSGVIFALRMGRTDVQMTAPVMNFVRESTSVENHLKCNNIDSCRATSNNGLELLCIPFAINQVTEAASPEKRDEWKSC